MVYLLFLSLQLFKMPVEVVSLFNKLVVNKCRTGHSYVVASKTSLQPLPNPTAYITSFTQLCKPFCVILLKSEFLGLVYSRKNIIKHWRHVATMISVQQMYEQLVKETCTTCALCRSTSSHHLIRCCECQSTMCLSCTKSFIVDHNERSDNMSCVANCPSCRQIWPDVFLRRTFGSEWVQGEYYPLLAEHLLRLDTYFNNDTEVFCKMYMLRAAVRYEHEQIKAQIAYVNDDLLLMRHSVHDVLSPLILSEDYVAPNVFKYDDDDTSSLPAKENTLLEQSIKLGELLRLNEQNLELLDSYLLKARRHWSQGLEYTCSELPDVYKSLHEEQQQQQASLAQSLRESDQHAVSQFDHKRFLSVIRLLQSWKVETKLNDLLEALAVFVELNIHGTWKHYNHIVNRHNRILYMLQVLNKEQYVSTLFDSIGNHEYKTNIWLLQENFFRRAYIWLQDVLMTLINKRKLKSSMTLPMCLYDAFYLMIRQINEESKELSLLYNVREGFHCIKAQFNSSSHVDLVWNFERIE